MKNTSITTLDTGSIRNDVIVGKCQSLALSQNKTVPPGQNSFVDNDKNR